MGYYADKSTGRGQLYLVTREGTKLFILIFFSSAFKFSELIRMITFVQIFANEPQMFSNDFFTDFLQMIISCYLRTSGRKKNFDFKN